MSKKILIGKIIAPFGIKGEVKIVSYCEEPLKIETYPLFDDKGRAVKLKISNKNKAIIGTVSGEAILIAKIDGINDRNASEDLRGTQIFVNRKDFADTKDNEFYYVDLIGLDVINMNSQKIGKVINVLDHGAGAVIEIKFDADVKAETIDNFPFTNAIFPEVNLRDGFIRIDVPEVVEAG
jgi:16S rRNA processing protein RimM